MGACPSLIRLSFIPAQWRTKIRCRNLPRLRTAPWYATKVVEIIPLHICIGDLCPRIWFGVVNTLALNVLLGTTYINKLIEGIFLMRRWVVPIHSRAETIFTSSLTPPLIVASVSNNAERSATGDAKEPQKAQTAVHAIHTVSVIKNKTIPP